MKDSNHRYTPYYKTILLLLCISYVSSVVFAQEGIDAKIDIVEVENGYVMNAINNEPFPIYAVIHFSKLEGLQPSSVLPAIVSLAVGDNNGVFSLKKNTSSSTISYQVSYKFLFTYPIANPTANPTDSAFNNYSHDVLYLFPYQHGTQYRMIQAWNTKHTKNPFPNITSSTISDSISNMYSVGFDMPEGTEVYAARDGVVVDIKSNSIIGGNSPIYVDKANFVLIKHDDNTLGYYTHLQYQGVLVKVGQIIKAGALIGYSGGTGYVDGNRLDFSVQVSKINGEIVNIPFYFRGKNDIPIEPKRGYSYYAYVPGQPAFREVHGENITKEQYIQYRKKLRPRFPLDIIKIRELLVDDTVVLFIQNGFDRNVSTDIYLTLNNVLIDAPMPLAVHIPARHEIFLAIVTIEHMEKEYSISSRMQYTFVENTIEKRN